MISRCIYTSSEQSCIQVEYDSGTIQTWKLPLPDVAPEELKTWISQNTPDLPPEPTYDQLRRAAYEANGADEHNLIVALWEHIVEGRSEAMNAIQVIRENIKLTYPKS